MLRIRPGKASWTGCVQHRAEPGHGHQVGRVAGQHLASPARCSPGGRTRRRSRPTPGGRPARPPPRPSAATSRAAARAVGQHHRRPAPRRRAWPRGSSHSPRPARRRARRPSLLCRPARPIPTERPMPGWTAHRYGPATDAAPDTLRPCGAAGRLPALHHPPPPFLSSRAHIWRPRSLGPTGTPSRPGRRSSWPRGSLPPRSAPSSPPDNCRRRERVATARSSWRWPEHADEDDLSAVRQSVKGMDHVGSRPLLQRRQREQQSVLRAAQARQPLSSISASSRSQDSLARAARRYRARQLRRVLLGTRTSVAIGRRSPRMAGLATRMSARHWLASSRRPHPTRPQFF